MEIHFEKAIYVFIIQPFNNYILDYIYYIVVCYVTATHVNEPQVIPVNSILLLYSRLSNAFNFLF